MTIYQCPMCPEQKTGYFAFMDHVYEEHLLYFDWFNKGYETRRCFCGQEVSAMSFPKHTEKCNVVMLMHAKLLGVEI